MPSAIKMGSVNLPKMMRHISHRTSQVRDLTFIRDAIYNKDYKKYPANATSGTELSGPPVNFGYETTSTTGASFTKAQDSGTVTHRYVSSPEMVLPGLTMLQSPISSRSGNLERGGHRITGSCTFYAPSLDYIKTLDNFKNAVAFAELESYDKLIDIEKILQTPADIAVPVPNGGALQSVATFSDATAGYEIDRLQFTAEIKDVDSNTYENLSRVRIGGNIDGSDAYLQWAPLGGTDGMDIRTTAGNNYYNLKPVVIDLPIKGVKAGDTTTIWENGEGFTYTASISNNFDIDKLIGDSNNELGYIKISLGSAYDTPVTYSNIKLYKEAEWRVQSIRDYRDEYMQIGAVRVRGERASRRRAYG